MTLSRLGSDVRDGGSGRGGDATLWTLDDVLAGAREPKVCFEADVMRIYHVDFTLDGDDPALHRHTRG